jgi:hypothetical protein
MSNLRINDFVSNLSKGLASANKYKCEFFSPVTKGNDKSISIMCNVAQLPGRDIQTVDNRHYGVPFKLPYNAVYVNSSFSFVNTNGLPERRFFEDWQSLVLKPDTGLIGFRNDYIGTIKISILNSGTGEPEYSVFLWKAYPINLSEVSLGYSMSNEVMLTTVAMAFEYWTNEDYEFTAC